MLESIEFIFLKTIRGCASKLQIRHPSCFVLHRNMSGTVIVNVQQGALRGQEKITKTGFKYYSFKGIPYAKPPIGSLRFKAPQPPESWSGIKDAFKEGPICAQKDIFLLKFKGEEDCLFLNVYTPKNPSNSGTLLPVMVWFHGGGFAGGSGNSDIYGPDFLVAEDVVLVTMNYRLGPFGFLSLENEKLSGNAGLKDQVMALRWVQQNIAKFCGDPSNVTIFGESAGGSSVHYHLLSPMSKGLFHRAISQSGSALNWWAFTTNARERAFRLAEALGFTTKNDDELLQFLQNAPAESIVENINKSRSKEDIRQMLAFPFVPTVETVQGPEEVFLPAHPIDIINSGKFIQLPYITGTNSHEGMIFLQGHTKAKIESINKDVQCLIPPDTGIKLDTDLSRNIGKEIKKIYLNDKPISEKTLGNYADIISDTWFSYSINKTAKLHAAKSSAPVYYYQFSFDGELGLFKKLLGLSDFKGVCHADELGYLFRNGIVDIDLETDSSEYKTVSRLVKLWTNFAKTGNPAPNKTPLLDTVWKPVEINKMYRLSIGSSLSLEESKQDQRIMFWDHVYSTSSVRRAKL